MGSKSSLLSIERTVPQQFRETKSLFCQHQSTETKQSALFTPVCAFLLKLLLVGKVGIFITVQNFLAPVYPIPMLHMAYTRCLLTSSAPFLCFEVEKICAQLPSVETSISRLSQPFFLGKSSSRLSDCVIQSGQTNMSKMPESNTLLLVSQVVHHA